jgi:hypothetical protein
VATATVALAVAAFGLLTVGSASASELSWSAPQKIDATESPRPYPTPRVSCATASSCVAVDENSNGMVFDGSSWTAPTSIKGSYPFELLFFAVSCPTTSFCAAVGSGEAVTYSAGTWSQPTSIEGALSVSCPSSSFCVAVNSGGGALTYNGSSWSAATDIDGSTEIGSVSCPSSSFCLAADYEGHALTYNGSSWSAPADIDGTEGIGGVSCPSSSFCAAVDWSGDALTYNGSSWSAASNIDGNALTSVSCPSASFCAAVGDSGDALTYNGSSWTNATGVYGPSEGASVSCPSSSFCVAADAHGNATIYAEHEAVSGGGSGGGGPAPPRSAPSNTTPPTGVVALSTTTIAAKANGTASVSLACTGTARCNGAVELAIDDGPAKKDARAARKAKATAIGRAKFSIAPGKTAIVKIKLNATGRTLLKAHHGKLTATLIIRKFSPSPAATTHKTVHIVQKGAK